MCVVLIAYAHGHCDSYFALHYSTLLFESLYMCRSLVTVEPAVQRVVG